MKQFMRYSLLSIFVVLYCVALSGCTPDAPSIESVETCFESNYEDILTVVDFIANSDCDLIIIRGSDGTMRADSETVTIEEENVYNAVKRLLVSNGAYCLISKYKNTIQFEQWQGSIVDIGCGIAYSINETDWPYIEFATEIEPLSRSGWYYYVDDYNAWRTGKRP